MTLDDLYYINDKTRFNMMSEQLAKRHEHYNKIKRLANEIAVKFDINHKDLTIRYTSLEHQFPDADKYLDDKYQPCFTTSKADLPSIFYKNVDLNIYPVYYGLYLDGELDNPDFNKIKKLIKAVDLLTNELLKVIET